MASAAERVVAVLRDAADAYEALPPALRTPPPFLGGPLVNPANLRTEAGNIERTIAVIRGDDAAGPLPVVGTHATAMTCRPDDADDTIIDITTLLDADDVLHGENVDGFVRYWPEIALRLLLAAQTDPVRFAEQHDNLCVVEHEAVSS